METFPNKRIFRPNSHITPKKGWINDPNGFIWFKGQYHLYCQHNPHDLKWGPMHWLHFVSDDLLHFEEVGISLKPDHPYDQEFGCFSGSAIEKDGKLFVLYTGCSNGKQTQCLAISNDGHRFEKYEGNPVLGEADLPEGYLVSDFRDPKLFRKGDRYYALLVSRHKDGYCSILLYESADLIHYSFVGVVKSFHNLQDNGMAECPDILFEGGKTALLYSLQRPFQEGDKFQHPFPVAYVVGELNLTSGEFKEEGKERELDQGFACYATQSLSKEGRNYLVTWQCSWGYDYSPTCEEGYVGQLSLIKSAHIQGDRIILSFLPQSGQRHLRINVEKEKASLRIQNLDIRICKSERKVTVLPHGKREVSPQKGEKPFEQCQFRLESVDSIELDYVYDHSCVELRFQGGEAFVSTLDFIEDDCEEASIQEKGCIIADWDPLKEKAYGEKLRGVKNEEEA